MENQKNVSATIITGRRTRLSYANLFEPKGFDGSKPKYSVSLIIPKDDACTLACDCPSRLVWKKINDGLTDIVDSITLQDMLKEEAPAAQGD